MIIVDPVDMSKAFDAKEASPEQMYAVAVSGNVAKSIDEQKLPIEARLKEMLFSVDGRLGFAEWMKAQQESDAIFIREFDSLAVVRFGWPSEKTDVWSSQKGRKAKSIDDLAPANFVGSRIFMELSSDEVDSVEYASNPSMKVKEAKNARLYSEIFRRVLQRSRDALKRQVDHDIVTCVARASNDFSGEISGGIVLCHPKNLRYFLMDTGAFPVASFMVPHNVAYHLPGGRGSGYVDVKQVICSAADSPNEDYDEGRFGWVIGIDCRIGVRSDADIRKLAVPA